MVDLDVGRPRRGRGGLAGRARRDGGDRARARGDDRRASCCRCSPSGGTSTRRRRSRRPTTSAGPCRRAWCSTRCSTRAACCASRRVAGRRRPGTSRELGRRHARWDMHRPSPPWRSGAALALLALGDGAEARAARRRAGRPRPRVGHRALARPGTAGRGALRAGGGTRRGAGRRGRLRSTGRRGGSSSPAPGATWAPSCAARAAAARRGRSSRRRWALAHACGATPLAERAADELRASGARPRRRAITGMDALTPSEERVAWLAAAGRTNRDIAQELFITLATVETHLTRAYRKLGVPGRDGARRRARVR